MDRWKVSANLSWLIGYLQNPQLSCTRLASSGEPGMSLIVCNRNWDQAHRTAFIHTPWIFDWPLYITSVQNKHFSVTTQPLATYTANFFADHAVVRASPCVQQSTWWMMISQEKLFTEKDYFIQFSRTSLQPPREVDNLVLETITPRQHLSSQPCLNRRYSGLPQQTLFPKRQCIRGATALTALLWTIGLLWDGSSTWCK